MVIEDEANRLTNIFLLTYQIAEYPSPFSPRDPPPSPLVTVHLFLISMSLVIFCLLACFVDQVPLRGFSVISVKDTWTKLRGSGIRGERWGLLGPGRGVQWKRQTTILEQQSHKIKLKITYQIAQVCVDTITTYCKSESLVFCNQVLV